MKLIVCVSESYCLCLTWGPWIGWKCVENPTKVHIECKCVLRQVLKKVRSLLYQLVLQVPSGYSRKLDYSLCPLVTLSVGLYHMKGIKTTLFKNIHWDYYIKEYWTKTNSCQYTFDNRVLNLKLMTSI